MENFTPLSALAGGALIGAAASILLWLTGRIAGISGIVGGLLAPAAGETGWRALFTLGLIGGAALYRAAGGPLQAIEIETSPMLLIAGGLLVGFGTRMGGGCTSGHGVCGLARLSRRSLVATAVFMISAGVTVAVVRHLWGGTG